MIAHINERELISPCDNSSSGYVAQFKTGYKIEITFHKDEEVPPERIYKNVLLCLAKQLEKQDYILPVSVEVKP